MTEALSLAVVAAAGLFFISLGSASFLAPARVSRFLLGFAASPLKHYLELLLRLLIGGAFILAAPRLLAPVAFSLFGWLLILTSAGLLIIPWHWHRRFALRTVPTALRFLPLVGFASAALGGFVLWAVLHGNAA